jgi:hypothetical protein
VGAWVMVGLGLPSARQAEKVKKMDKKALGFGVETIVRDKRGSLRLKEIGPFALNNPRHVLALAATQVHVKRFAAQFLHTFPARSVRMDGVASAALMAQGVSSRCLRR